MLEALNGPIYEVKQVCKPLLLRLDSLLADKGVEYTSNIISVEHVLPQNPKEGSNWLESESFPNEDCRQYWTHKLANLVLLSKRKNSEASNFEFEQKKEKYFKTDKRTMFALTQEAIVENEWTPDILKERQKRLIDCFKKEWRLE